MDYTRAVDDARGGAARCIGHVLAVAARVRWTGLLLGGPVGLGGLAHFLGLGGLIGLVRVALTGEP